MGEDESFVNFGQGGEEGDWSIVFGLFMVFAWFGNGDDDCFFPGKGKVADSEGAVDDPSKGQYNVVR